jgi:hypothetical protein
MATRSDSEKAMTSSFHGRCIFGERLARLCTAACLKMVLLLTMFKILRMFSSHKILWADLPTHLGHPFTSQGINEAIATSG